MADSPEPASGTTETDESANGTVGDRRYLAARGIVKQKVHGPPVDGPVSDAPPPPSSLEDLEFEPQPMVGWYRPGELVKAGVEAVVSSVFGSYADKREVEALLSEDEWHDYSQPSRDLWIDYVADLGDGWDSTYTIARLLAEPELSFDQDGRCVTDPGKATTRTRRGHILVMGGDQVYPTANQEQYANRLIQPYRCALPFEPETRAPHLYLIPGNHDWYDGLNSFYKLFCHEQWVGAWKTWQHRSYFALKLVDGGDTSDLWLWGIDIQLNANIDQPQLDYFAHIAGDQMAPHSKIILCTAEPSWVYVDAKTKEESQGPKREKLKEDIYHNLGHLERKIIRKHEHEVVVGLAGDWHNYTRYEAENGARQRFVAGGGGAYLYPTHNMPETLTLPKRFRPAGSDAGPDYRRAKVFPGAKESQRLARNSLFFPLFRLNWGFAAFLGVFYLILAWVVQSVSKVTLGDAGGSTLLETFRTSLDLDAFIVVIAHSPSSVVFLLALVVGLIGFSGFTTPWKKILHGGLHGVVHVALFLLLLRLLAWFNLDVLGLGVNQPLQVTLFGVEMLVLGGFLGSVVLGVYLWLSNRFLKIHDNEVLLCQSNPDFKNFLRLHISKTGDITIYPIGVPAVNRKRSWKFDQSARQLAAWKLQTGATNGSAWFEPEGGKRIQEFAQLIEEPITVPRTGGGG